MASDSPTGSKDAWDKLPALSGLLAAVLVPLALGLAGHWYSNAIQERETALKEKEFAREWVQLSLDILRTPQATPDQEALRRWAVKVINHYSDSEIQMDDTLQQDFVAGRARLPEPPAPGESRARTVEQLETEALNALLARDIDAAIAAMQAAWEAWPEFRTVQEALALLKQRRERLGPEADAQAWRSLYGELRATMDVRGIDPETVERLKRAAEGG